MTTQEIVPTVLAGLGTIGLLVAWAGFLYGLHRARLRLFEWYDKTFGTKD